MKSMRLFVIGLLAFGLSQSFAADTKKAFTCSIKSLGQNSTVFHQVQEIRNGEARVIIPLSAFYDVSNDKTNRVRILDFYLLSSGEILAGVSKVVSGSGSFLAEAYPQQAGESFLRGFMSISEDIELYFDCAVIANSEAKIKDRFALINQYFTTITERDNPSLHIGDVKTGKLIKRKTMKD